MRIESLFFRPVGISFHAGERDEKYCKSIKALLNGAQSSIKIVADKLNPSFYGGLELFEIFMRALARGVVIELVVGPEASKEVLNALASLQGPIYLHQLPHWGSARFAVIDDTHVRIEEPYAPAQEEGVDYIIHNYKYAREFVRTFNELKDQAAPFKDL